MFRHVLDYPMADVIDDHLTFHAIHKMILFYVLCVLYNCIYDSVQSLMLMLESVISCKEYNTCYIVLTTDSLLPFER